MIEPRQNGKGSILEARVLAGLFLFGEQLIIWTAHEYKTAMEGFLRVKQLIDSSEQLSAMVKIRNSGMETSIELKETGARIKFIARSRGSGRGFSCDCLILDEAYALDDNDMAAILPTLSAKSVVGNPQVWYTSSAPLLESAVLRRICKRGRHGAPNMAYFEWCADDNADPLDRAAWAQANPAYGVRISEAAILQEYGTMDEESFLRERLGIWFEDLGDLVFPSDAWDLSADGESTVLDPVCFAIDATPDRKYASIALAGRRADGRLHGEVVDSRKGMGWVVDRLEELVTKWNPCAVVLDLKGPAGGLLPAITERGIKTKCGCHGEHEVFLISTPEATQACGQLYDAVVEDMFRHRAQDVLDVALMGAKKRDVNDAWLFDRKSSAANISPLVAVTYATFGFSVHGPSKTASVYEEREGLLTL